ncbi:hypothetical protein [Anditalea andensis]|uniref:DUF1570 domain-containing protein n=1 Tax=Anditalea andensis TaxID=1048983 RepID=A0A074LMU8_9BACT|nr:hypothetical protein [Anditalea andensis]KEO75212.1 hypothetical protein EL17_06005 [Anditalea andensis]
MKLNLIILLILVGFSNCQSQTINEEDRVEEIIKEGVNNKIEVEIHSRVDMTKIEIRAIANLWINYLNSEPDKISDNPYWNEEEKNLYEGFDLSRNLLYQFPSGQLLRHFKPKILSIEKEGDNYGIRTMYSAEGLEGEYRKSNPWAIQKLYAVQENSEWRLKNSLPIITADWNRKTVGKISFIYPHNHKFNQELADKANQFCNQISREFNFPEWEPFDFYITHSGDELGKLLNFDFFFAGYTTGIGMNEKRMLLSGFGSEYYPHEFVHLIVPKFERHSLIDEGFATWKGGAGGGKTFEESAILLANELTDNNTVSFSDIIDKKWGWQYTAYYTTGAILCHAAYENGGIRLVNELLQIPDDRDNLIDNLCSIFNIEKTEFEAFWRVEVLKFRNI